MDGTYVDENTNMKYHGYFVCLVFCLLSGVSGARAFTCGQEKHVLIESEHDMLQSCLVNEKCMELFPQEHFQHLFQHIVPLVTSEYYEDHLEDIFCSENSTVQLHVQADVEQKIMSHYLIYLYHQGLQTCRQHEVWGVSGTTVQCTCPTGNICNTPGPFYNVPLYVAIGLLNVLFMIHMYHSIQHARFMHKQVATIKITKSGFTRMLKSIYSA